MIKIAHLTTVDISLRYFLLDQLRFLKQNDFDVYAISSNGEHVPVIENAGIKHISVKISRSFFSPLRDVLSLIKLVRILRIQNFQIVHTHTPKASFLGQIAARIAGVPIIVRTLHGFYFHEFTPPLAKLFMVSMERIAGNISDLILSQNAEDIQTAVKNGICKPEKIVYLGNGINLQEFDPDGIDPVKREKLRREFKIGDNDHVIGFVGRLVEEKGLLELFQAVQIVRERLPGIKVLIVGPIDSEKKDAVTPEKADRYGISDICIFTGHQEYMPLYYSLMDIFVLPSYREGYPRSAMEASAMTVPSILTDIRGCREVVQHGVNGLLVPVKNATALAQSITELLTDESKARMMGAHGREKALSDFNERRLFDIVLTNYRQLLDRKATAGS
jgi:glycosyltransferase involved in cell wall biosynthesis